MRRLVAFAVTLILVMSLALTPGAAVAAPRSPITGVENIDSAAKVAPELRDAFAKGKYVSYMVTLHEQADKWQAANAARAEFSSANAASAELNARVGVIRALKETANRAQRGLMTALENAKGKGLVKSFQSYYIINALEVTSTVEVMEAIAGRPEVAQLWPNTRRLLIDPSKPSAEPDSVGITSTEWNVEKVSAPQAWGLGIDGAGMVVANLDTGVDWTHPALQRKWRGYDPATGATDPIYNWFDAVNGQSMPYDDHAHGTHTMGTMVGSDPEGVNQIGIAPGAQWIAVKILDSGGYGNDADILAGAEWLLAPGGDPSRAPDAVNNSWGGGPGVDEWFRPAVQAWRAAGIFPEFAAGNSGPGAGSVTAPGNYPESVTVGMTNINDQLDSGSGRGPAPYPTPDDMKPDVVAPGVNVRSSVPGGGYQGGWSGTSMASPHVTAASVLVKQADPTLTVDQIEQILKDTAFSLEDAQYTGRPNYGYGWGRINVFDAVSEILTGRGEVSGRVLVGGDDFEPPQVQHEPVTLVYEGFDVPLTVQASDNVSIVSVEAFVRPTGAANYTYVPLDRVSGDYKSGTYVGYAPWYLFDTDYGAEYYIRVNDYGNNAYTSQVYGVDVEVGVEPGYVQDFESNPMGWIHGPLASTTKDPWQWGEPTSGPNAAHSGTKVYATNLSGNYDNSTQAYLMAPPIDLTSGSPALFTYWHWYDLESGYDYGRVYISTDGTNFSSLKSYNGASGGWAQDTINLTPYTGQVVYLLFAIQTDGSVSKPGWYIDDVALVGPDTVAPAAPANLQVQPTVTGEPSLTWDLVSEPDVTGYRIYRSTTPGSDYALIGTAATAQFVDPIPVNNVPNYYVVTAFDMGNNESPYSNEVSITPILPETMFYDDFEAGENGWTHGGAQDVWQLGTPTTGPGVAHSGVSLWATNLTGNYNSGSNFWLQSPAIDLTNYVAASLSFWHWYELETNFDKGYVEISTDNGTTWTQLAMYTHSTNGKVWAQPVLDLTPYVGTAVLLRFRVTSDGSVNKQGWYIDDVKIMGVQITSASLEPEVTPSEKKETEFPAPVLDWSKLRMPRAAAARVITPMALPAQATVTVLETGATARTNPATGAYSLQHAAGAYTMKAEAYGYYPVEQAVSIIDDATTTANFFLNAIPQGTLSGLVYDERTEQPIAGAEIYLREDAHVAPVTTGADGLFVLNGLEGDYTLHVSAPGYYAADVSVTVIGNTTTEYNVPLRPFIGYPGELAYDDGTPTNAYTMNSAGNGFAVRFTPERAPAQINTVSFLFWGTDWPSPGGTVFQYAIYGVNPDGTPGALLAGPFNATAIRDPNTWTTIDVSGLGLTVDGEFIVAEIQPNVGPSSPGMCVDEDTADTGRNLAYLAGSFVDWIEAGGTGNIMIRSSVLYPVGVPAVTSPVNGACVNTPVITVEGTAAPGVTVDVYLGGVLANAVTANADGTFAAPVTLVDGANIITVDATVNGKYTDLSAPVEIILDMVVPTLTVAPVDGSITNQSAIVLVVNGADEHLSDTITVAQGTAAPAPSKNDGTSEWRVPVELVEGLNTFTVTVYDRATNSASETVNITRDTVAPALNNLVPAADITVTDGVPVTFSFDSEPGLTASYLVSVPVPAASGFTTMSETAPGHFEGVWTLPEGTVLGGAEVLFRAVDTAGNVTEATAAGKLITGTTPPPVVEDLTLTPTPGAYTTNGDDGMATAKKFHIAGTVSSAITSVKIGKARMTITNGAFTYDFALVEGVNNIVVNATKNDGTVITENYTVTLDSPISISGLKAMQVKGNYLEVTGKTDPGATVVIEVKDGSGAVVDTISVTAGADGSFVGLNTVAIPAGRYSIDVTATDPLNNTGTASISVTLKKAVPAPVQ